MEVYLLGMFGVAAFFVALALIFKAIDWADSNSGDHEL
jgi:hypothetical protein